MTHEKKEACRYCDDSHRDRECKRWASAGNGALSSNDNDSDYIAVSNIRVWRENHRETEGELWRHRTGAYGSSWIDVRTALRDLTTKDALYTRAESLGLTGLTAIVDDLCSLVEYPCLDESDASECEMDECAEHWESYGRSDFERALEAALPEGADLETLMERAQGTFRGQRFDGFESTDALARFVQSNADCYPERIDSSAWDFRIEADRWRPSPSGVGKLVEGALTCLGFPWHGPVTLAQHVKSLSWGSPERAVWADLAKEMQAV
jgi:hypothetical protein